MKYPRTPSSPCVLIWGRWCFSLVQKTLAFGKKALLALAQVIERGPSANHRFLPSPERNKCRLEKSLWPGSQTPLAVTSLVSPEGMAGWCHQRSVSKPTGTYDCKSTQPGPDGLRPKRVTQLPISRLPVISSPRGSSW